MLHMYNHSLYFYLFPSSTPIETVRTIWLLGILGLQLHDYGPTLCIGINGRLAILDVWVIVFWIVTSWFLTHWQPPLHHYVCWSWGMRPQLYLPLDLGNGPRLWVHGSAQWTPNCHCASFCNLFFSFSLPFLPSTQLPCWAVQYILYTTAGTLLLTLVERGRGRTDGVCCGGRTRDVVIRCYRMTGIYTFVMVLLSQLYSVTWSVMVT